MATGTLVDVVMPQMGVSVSEGTITRWAKAVGETIEADETIVEISTDKVDTEVPSPAAGVAASSAMPPSTTTTATNVHVRAFENASSAAHSRAPAAMTASVTTPKAHGRSRKSARSTTASITAAVTTRVATTDGKGRPGTREPAHASCTCASAFACACNCSLVRP